MSTYNYKIYGIYFYDVVVYLLINVISQPETVANMGPELLCADIIVYPRVLVRSRNQTCVRMFTKLLITGLYLLSFLRESSSVSEAQGIYSVTDTKYGPVRGVVTGNGSDTVRVYMGVPFAKPPIGNLRFKEPQPPDNWTVTRDATLPSSDCMQVLTFGPLGQQNVSEDCLYLNVYSPFSEANRTLKPVMVWIFGGGFNSGSATVYDGTALARKDVVLVTFNYRLDAFGFLSTEDDILPGNFGLHDQIFALKWVKENIASFGGDPNQVTLFGESAGGCSVSILTLSPLAKGLFKRVIMESGSALSPWCISYPKARLLPRNIAATIGSKVHCDLQSSNQFLHCLQNVDAEELLNASFAVQLSSKAGMILLPRVEHTFGVLPDFPSKILTNGQSEQVDTIIGFNSNEAGGLKENFAAGAEREEVTSLLFRGRLGFFLWPDKDYINRELENLYFENVTDPVQLLHRASDVATDFSFAAPALLESLLATESAGERKHYVYEFNYRKSQSGLPSWATAEHGDELFFVFGKFDHPITGPYLPSQDDLMVAEQVMTMWTNFAKTGDPTSSVPQGATRWQPFNSSVPGLLNIGLMSRMTSAGRQDAVKLYKSLLSVIENNAPEVVVG
ncbi:Liver carboxylesterase 1 [Bulinus truncatus]|nr:Liver carboxylesterase 1 [Bulinus truncatus]